MIVKFLGTKHIFICYHRRLFKDDFREPTGLQEEQEEHGLGKWEGKQKGKSDKGITESKARQKEALNCASQTTADLTKETPWPSREYNTWRRQKVISDAKQI
jgi:hypothetical protein